MHYVKSYVWGALVISAVSIGLACVFSFPLSVFSQSGGTAITGYAWSETIGWIDLNCLNTSSCGTSSFGLSVASDGTISGYAWSENIGWVSANATNLTGCPTAPCTANLSPTALTGWLKALAGNDAQNGGWDGFIKLNAVGSGIAYSAGNFSTCNPDASGANCAWGDINVGWVDFSRAHTTFNTCSSSAGSSYSCWDTQTIVARTTDVSCNVSFATTTCTLPQYCSNGSPVCLWPQVGANPGGTLIAKPSLIPKNASTTVYWDIANTTGCTVTGTNGDSWSGASSNAAACTHTGTRACVSSLITSQTIYTLSCTGLDSSVFSQTATVNIIPGFEETCAPGDAHVNGKCVRQ